MTANAHAPWQLASTPAPGSGLRHEGGRDPELPARPAAGRTADRDRPDHHVHVGAHLIDPGVRADAVHRPEVDRRRVAAATVTGLAAGGTLQVTWSAGQYRAAPSPRSAAGTTLHLHVHGLEDLRRATPLGLASRGPLVLHLHESSHRPALAAPSGHRLVVGCLRPLLRRARLVVVRTQAARRRASELGASHVLVPAPAPLPPAQGLAHQPPRPALRLRRRIVVIQPPPSAAGVLDLLEVLAAQPPDVGLVLLGPGVESQTLRRAVRQLGLGPRLEVRRRPTRAEIDAHVRHADVVASLSSDGGNDFGLLRAMELGRPVVAVTTADRRRLVSTGVDGLLVPAAHRWGLAAGLHRVLADPPLAEELGAGAARRAAARSWADVGSEILHALPGR